jgi:hypothetical protein
MEPREIIDGTLLAVWEHLRLGFFLAWGLTLFFVIFGHTSLLGGLLSITTAMLFGVVLAMLGILCSLTARNVTAALAPTIAFPLLLCIVPPLLTDSLRADVMFIVRVATLIGLGIGFILICWRINVWTVAIWITAMHFAFAGVGQIWSDGGHRNSTPIIGMNPAALTVMTLVDELDNVIERENVNFDGYGYRARLDYSDKAILVTLSEWLALVGTFFCARWWTIRHFDELVGRRELTGSSTWLRSRAKYPAAIPQPAPRVSASGES